MHYCKPADTLDYFHERELNEMKAITAHWELAIAAALNYCAEEEICPPPWVVKGAADLMCNLLKREKAQKRGRTAGHIARYRQDLWDLERFDAILAIREVREKVRENLKIMREKHLRRKFEGTRMLQDYQKYRTWLRHGTFQCASMYLVGRDARAGVHAMKASCRRVRRNTVGKTAPDQYYPFEERFLRKLGFPSLMDRKPGTKFLLLYDLTP